MKATLYFILPSLWLFILVSCDQFPRDNPNDPVNLNMDGSVADGESPPGPSIVLHNEPYIDDDPEISDINNGNGRIEAGERVFISFSLQNQGEEPALGVSATLTSDSDCGANIRIGETGTTPSSYGDIAPGQLSTPPAAMGTPYYNVLFATPDCTGIETVEFTIEVIDMETRTWSPQFQVDISQRELDIEWVETVIDDDFTYSENNNDNGYVEPGETAHISFILRNNGDSLVRGLQTEIPTTSESGCIRSSRPSEGRGGSIYYGNLSPGDTRPLIEDPDAPYYIIIFSTDDCSSDEEESIPLTITDASDSREDLSVAIEISYSKAEIVGGDRIAIDDNPEISDENDDDSNADPGETVNIVVNIENSGVDIARGVSISPGGNQLDCIHRTSVVGGSSNSIQYGDLYPNQQASPEENAGTIQITFSEDECDSGSTTQLLLVAEDNVGRSWLFEVPIDIDD